MEIIREIINYNSSIAQRQNYQNYYLKNQKFSTLKYFNILYSCNFIAYSIDAQNFVHNFYTSYA